jgi:hypothetical protein
MHDQQSIQTRDVTTALKEPIRSLRDAVARLEAGLVGDVQLRSITVSLISTWRLIERNPGFEVAAADLLAAARQLASPVPSVAPARVLRLLREAHGRLEERLGSARVATERTVANPALLEDPQYEAQPGVEIAPDRTYVPPAVSQELPVLDDATVAQIAVLARSLAPRMAA